MGLVVAMPGAAEHESEIEAGLDGTIENIAAALRQQCEICSLEQPP